jgi:ubiquitin-protein ligase
MAAKTRLQKELDILLRTPKPFIELVNTNDMKNWYCKIILPAETKYSVKNYNLHIQFPENYPFSYPTIQFLEKVEPENEFIDNTIISNEKNHGNVCPDFIHKNWGPTITFIKLMEKVYDLLLSR